jgi:hypothetical protein
MPADIREELSRALKPVDEQYARLAGDGRTEATVVPTMFLRRHRIYRVEYFAPSKPVLFYVGFAQGELAYLLTARVENYVRMGKADGVTIRSPEVAANFAAVFLEVTRSMSDLFYVVNAVGDLRWRPNLTAGQDQAKASFIQHYSSVIQPPSARAQGQSYAVTVYAVREQALERHRLIVRTEGDISDEVKVSEQDLPLVYGL